MSAPSPTKILVVDDVPDRLIAMQAILEELGQQIVTVTSGREALRRLLHEEFAVILLDVNMPDLDGFETAALIRQRKRSEHTPIIFVTAWGDEANASHGYSLGAVDYILTPVVPEILRAKVRVFVDLFQKNEQLKQHVEQQAALVALADRRAGQLRRLAAELASAEQRERRRLAQVLHDHIQQLLVAARMRVDRARMHADDGETQQELVGVTELINETITASRSLAADLSPPVLNEAGLGAALEWLARWMRDNYNLRVEVYCEPGIHPISEEMRVTLFQAVRELLFNVVKHSGTDSASVRMERIDGEWLDVAVEDQGIGFDLSTTGEHGTAGEHGGPGGLGLFSIRERIEILGGRFGIDTDRDTGTRITLSAPLVTAEAQTPADDSSCAIPVCIAAATQPDEEGTNGQKPAERLRVLVVDDHAILRKGLRGLLESKADVEVVGEAGNGEEAVAQARALLPHVVIMDINMPRMNGIEATRRIKDELPQVAVIGLSLHEDQEVVDSMRRAGAIAYVMKGGPPEELFEALTTVRNTSLALAPL